MYTVQPFRQIADTRLNALLYKARSTLSRVRNTFCSLRQYEALQKLSECLECPSFQCSLYIAGAQKFRVLWNIPVRKIPARKFPTATLFWFVARFARLGILNSRPGGSREVLVSVSESGSTFYSILLTVALFLCSYVASVYFYLIIKC